MRYSIYSVWDYGNILSYTFHGSQSGTPEEVIAYGREQLRLEPSLRYDWPERPPRVGFVCLPHSRSFADLDKHDPFFRPTLLQRLSLSPDVEPIPDGFKLRMPL